MSEYTDVRELLDGYKTIPCEKCDSEIYVTNDFRPDEWFCREHTPRRLNVNHLFDDPTVRLSNVDSEKL